MVHIGGRQLAPSRTAGSRSSINQRSRAASAAWIGHCRVHSSVIVVNAVYRSPQIPSESDVYRQVPPEFHVILNVCRMVAIPVRVALHPNVQKGRVHITENHA